MICFRYTIKSQYRSTLFVVNICNKIILARKFGLIKRKFEFTNYVIKILNTELKKFLINFNLRLPTCLPTVQH